MEDVRTLKQELREELRRRRRALSPEDARAASSAVCALVAELPAFRRARTITAFASIEHEIDVGALAAQKPRVGWPRVERRDPPTLAFHAVAGPAALTPDRWGIPTPPAEAPIVAAGEIELFLVPGLAFDGSGGRLGYGRGYYDTALASAPQAWRVGVCHSFQLVDRVPHDAADQPVDVVVTPTGARYTRARPSYVPEDSFR